MRIRDLVIFLFTTQTALAGGWGYPELISLIESKDIRSIEALIPELPTSMRSNYVLMRKSRSLQPATDSQPRAILFSDDARLIVTLSGGTELAPSAQSLEIIHYLDESKSFEMREIVFSPPNPESERAKAQISTANPPRCLTCHRADPRPNWEAYPQWEGVYGKLADLFDEEETATYLSHLPAWKSHPRYGSLLELEAFGYQKHRNSSLTQRLAYLNFERVIDRILKIPQGNRYLVALAGAAWCTNKEADGWSFVQSWLPTDLQKLHSAERASRLRRPSEEGQKVPKPDFTYLLRYLFESRGVSTRDWSMSIEQKTYEFSTPGLVNSDWTHELILAEPKLKTYFEPRALDEYDPELARNIGFRDVFLWPTRRMERDELCQELRALSRGSSE